jgi:hypothetical protein
MSGSIVLLSPIDAQHDTVVRDLTAHLIERDGTWQPSLVEGLVADLHQRSGAHAVKPWHRGARPLVADAPVRLSLAELVHVENGGAAAGNALQSDEAPTITREARRASVAGE